MSLTANGIESASAFDEDTRPRRFGRTVKRAADLLVSALVLLLCLPILLVLYIWIRLDSAGPALHRSPRLGRGGKPFCCLKFRSMYVDAEERLEGLLEQDGALRTEYEAYHKLKCDPRVTPVGRILRKFSLDELPQLGNVLMGQMSLVGPRPYLVSELEEMNGEHETILERKPGVTGYWQVHLRSGGTFSERLEMESFYVRNWSIWWDLVLLWQTVGVVVGARNAH